MLKATGFFFFFVLTKNYIKKKNTRIIAYIS